MEKSTSYCIWVPLYFEISCFKFGGFTILFSLICLRLLSLSLSHLILFFSLPSHGTGSIRQIKGCLFSRENFILRDLAGIRVRFIEKEALLRPEIYCLIQDRGTNGLTLITKMGTRRPQRGDSLGLLCMCLLSRSDVSNSFETPQTVACPVPLSMGFPRQEYWSRLPFPSPGDLPHPGIKTTSPPSPTLSGRLVTTEPPGDPQGL